MINLLKTKPELTRRNLQIIACAGSGKTEFVSTRIAYLAAEGLAKPENISTFTLSPRRDFTVSGKTGKLMCLIIMLDRSSGNR
jgi:hypothetical protein